MKTLFVLSLLLSSLSAYAQRDTFLVQKVYFTREQVRDQAPEDTVSVLKLIERKPSEIKAGGGNDYKLTALDGENVPRQVFKKSIWATQYNDTLYLNGWHITKTKWYMKAETFGRYILLMTSLPKTMHIAKQVGLEEELKDVRKRDIIYGIAGGLGGGLGMGMAMAAASSKVDDVLSRYPIVYDLHEGALCKPVPEFVREYFSRYPKLREKYAVCFENSTKMHGNDLLIAFVNDLNTFESNPDASIEPLEPAGHDILQDPPHNEENEKRQP